MELVRSVMSKDRIAAPRLLSSREETAKTSPSTVTRPDSRVRVSIFTGLWRMARPMRTSPWEAEAAWFRASGAAETGAG